MPDALTAEERDRVAGQLRRRLEIIADTPWRDRDPEGHLDALREVSEGLVREHALLAPRMPVRLAHFFERCSYDKALAFLEAPLPGE